MLQVRAQLIDRTVSGASQELRLHAPELAGQLQPGQPVLVRTGWGLDPYLRRTLYPVSIATDSWTVRLPASGDRGHAWLRLAPLGTELDCLGPVGVGFKLRSGARRLLCLGEGEMCWALLPLVALADAGNIAVTLAAEAPSARFTIPAQRLPLTAEYNLTTVDGSRGRRGRLAPQLPDLLAWADAVAAAGSLAFYRQLADVIREQRLALSRGFAQVLYPASFLCGAGACLSCAADVAGGRRRVCLRGPVFDLLDVLA